LPLSRRSPYNKGSGSSYPVRESNCRGIERTYAFVLEGQLFRYAATSRREGGGGRRPYRRTGTPAHSPLGMDRVRSPKRKSPDKRRKALFGVKSPSWTIDTILCRGKGTPPLLVSAAKGLELRTRKVAGQKVSRFYRLWGEGGRPLGTFLSKEGRETIPALLEKSEEGEKRFSIPYLLKETDHLDFSSCGDGPGRPEQEFEIKREGRGRTLLPPRKKRSPLHYRRKEKTLRRSENFS